MVLASRIRLSCDYDDRDRTVHFQLQPKEIGDKCSLELWNLSYKKEIFEEEFNVKLTASVTQNN